MKSVCVVVIMSCVYVLKRRDQKRVDDGATRATSDESGNVKDQAKMNERHTRN